MGNSLIIRIDDRLIHGQVITGWVKTLGLNNIVVINDKLSKDRYKIEIIKIAVPSEVKLEFFSIIDAVQYYKEGQWKDYHTIFLVASPEEAYQLVENGCKFETINVGGLHYRDGCVKLTPNIYIDDTDREYLLKLSEKGIILEGRALPTDEAYNVIKVLNNFVSKNGIH